jgi:signal transduction histidine kinase/ligand-binding sensor domain-containing protein
MIFLTHIVRMKPFSDKTRSIEGFRRSTAAYKVLIAALSMLGSALNAAPIDIHYVRASFTVEDGLSSNIVNAVLQTRDGFLWAGTAGGLVRFDGRHFTAVEFPREVPRGLSITALAEAPDGALWVGTTGGLARIPAKAFKQFGPLPSAFYHPAKENSNSIDCLHFSRDGILWVGTDAGLFRFDHEKFSAVIPSLMISRIEESSNGHLLIITSLGFMEWDGVRTLQHPDVAARLGVKANEIFHVFEDDRGVTWYCTQAGVARSMHGSLERLSPYGLKSGSASAAFRAYEDAKGTIWIARSPGLSRVTPTGLELVMPGLHARYIAFDRDDELWTGTNGNGLFKYKHQTVQMFDSSDGLPGGVPVTVLAASDGKIWVGSNCGGLSWFDGRRFHTYKEKDGLTNSCVFSLTEDNKKNIWIGTYGGGIFRFRDGRFTQFSKPAAAGTSIARAIVPARDGSLWIGYNDGLTRTQNGKVQRFTVFDGLSSERIVSVYEDRSSVIWVETSAGIDRLVQNRFVAVSPITDALFDEDRSGQLFAFTFSGRTFQVQPKRVIDIPAVPQITGIAKSGDDLWFCGAGIYRASPDSLELWSVQPGEPRDYTRFGRADGMYSAECSNGYRNMATANDGKLWVATQQGLARLDYSRLPHDSRKPAVYIEKVVIEKIARTPERELVLAPGKHHLELHFAAIELAASERIRMQYRLDGVDRDWLDADTTATAIYTSLPVGAHKFHVRACNGDGVWDRAGIVYDITEKAFYYETDVFRAALIMILLSSLAIVYKLRLRHMRSQMAERLHERVEERARLARELHDTLLQTIQGCKIVADAALGNLGDSDLVRSALERISTWLTRATLEGRTAVGTLRASFAQSNALIDALQQTGDDCSLRGSMAFRISVDGSVRDLNPVMGYEIQRIGCEAVQNSCRHSNGTKVEVELSYGSDLILRVVDDGKGLSGEVLSDGGKKQHFGLAGMRERAKQIGGKLTFYSRHPGTEVELIIPGHLAYSKTPSPRITKL